MYSKFLFLNHKHKNFVSLFLALILCIQCMSFSGIEKVDAQTGLDFRHPSAPADFNVMAASGSAISLGTTKNMKDYIVASIGSEVTFRWNEKVHNTGIEGYEILRDDIPVAYTDKTEYTFSTLNQTRAERYCVVAYDKLGNYSDKSNRIHVIYDQEAFYNDLQAPSKPDNVTIEAVSGAAIKIAWAESIDNIGIECYEIYKNGNSIGFTRELYFLYSEHNDEEHNIYTVASYDLAGNVSEISEPAALKENEPYFDFMVHKTDRFIVKYKNNFGSVNLHGFLCDYIKESYPLSNRIGADIELIILEEKVIPGEFINQIKEKRHENGFDYYSDIEYIQEDYHFTVASWETFFEQDGDNTEPEVSENFAEALPMRKRNDITDVKGKNVIVAVLDTGIDITHEDLINNIWMNVHETPDNNMDDDGNGFADDVHGWNFVDYSGMVHNESEIYDEWHGTHLVGIITSIATESLIMPLKVFENGVAYTSNIISAIDYAERMGAKIVNCSWESADYNPVLKDVIDHSDMLFVCAAGNSHINIDEAPVYPAAFDSNNVISVAAKDSGDRFSKFSNFGIETIDAVALGEDILSTIPENGYGLSSGTSIAAAIITGEIALLAKQFENNRTIMKDRISVSYESLSAMTEQALEEKKVNHQNTNEHIDINEKTTMDTSNLQTTTVEFKVDMPDAFFGLAAVSLDGIVYILGGRYRPSLAITKVLDTAHVYSMGSDKWNGVSGMNSPRFYHAAATTNGKIYVFGGHDGNGILNTVEEYNPATRRWSMKAPMPTARLGACAVALGNLIYVIGGSGNNGSLNTVEVYNTLTNTWSNAPNMITARAYAAAGVIDNKIYIAGGSSGDNVYRSMEIYNPATNTWKYGASMSFGKTMGGGATVSGRFFSVGGLNEIPTINDIDWYIETTIEEYIPLIDTWVTNSYLVYRYFGFDVSSSENGFYVFGGTRMTLDYASNHFYRPKISEVNRFIYIYDHNDRLTEIKRVNKTVVKFYYDKNGNLLLIQRIE